MDSAIISSKSARTGLVAATAVTLGLDLVAVLRYPPTEREAGLAAAGGPVLLVALAAWLWWFGLRDTAKDTTAARRTGIAAGVIGGGLWVLEIAYNNFVSPLSTATVAAMVHRRDLVDDIFWGMVALAIFIGSIWASRTSGRWRDGYLAGLWGGLVSGLGACAMALALIAIWMEFILRDPVNIAEFAQRVGDRSPKAMATYFAYETMAGAFMHLVILGAIMGVLIGVVGGLIGKLIARATASTTVVDC